MNLGTFLKNVPILFGVMLYITGWVIVVYHEVTDQMNFAVLFVALQLTLITLGVFVVILAFLINKAESRENVSTL